MRAWVLVLALSGCGFSSSAANGNGDDGSGQNPGGMMPPDGSGGGTPDAGPVHVCLGTFVHVCADAPRGALSLMTATIDTSDISPTSKCLPAAAYSTVPAVDACVIASQTIAIPSGNTVSVTGNRRLILLADETLTITGTLDAASHRKGLTGPAADSGPCPTAGRAPTTSTEGGGGWGGTFGKSGSNGGNTPGGGMGGIAGSALQITALGGGCPGGAGANNGGGTGSGGHGGGAVLLLAGQSIKVDGAVNASGAGGSGGRARGGGGGGGSGGMIVLEAPAIAIPGQCFANGGGGGEGSSGLLDGAGGGESGTPDDTPGGGSSASVGGAGGDGGVGKTASKGGSGGTSIVNPIVDSGGGGAGGGGVGIIKIISPDPGNNGDLKKVSPPPS